jgi:hypothetical protein
LKAERPSQTQTNILSETDLFSKRENNRKKNMISFVSVLKKEDILQTIVNNV